MLGLGCLCELSLENNGMGNRGLHNLVDALKQDDVQTLTWCARTSGSVAIWV